MQPKSNWRFVSGRARAIAILLAAAYLAAFIATYIAFTHDAFGYLGFGYDTDWTAVDATLFVGFALLPAVWMPTAFDRPSAVFIYFQYYLIYVPALWMLNHSSLPPIEGKDVVELSGALLCGMMILVWAHHNWRLLQRPKIRIASGAFWTTIYGISALLFMLLVVLIGSNFHLVTLAEIYLVRAEVSDLIEGSGSRTAIYAFFWLNGFLFPLIVARAIASSNRVVLCLVMAGYFFLFGVWGSKATLFAPAILACVSVWAARRTDQMPKLMVFGLILLVTIPAMLPFDQGLGKLIKFWWISIVDMRTFAIPGILVAQYADYFSTHELTLGSHVTGINLLVNYPYDYDIPRTVGYYYYGDLVTSNANFWAQDGLAGFGPAGLIAMSFLAAAVLWILDSVTRGLHMRFVVTALSGIILGFANVSLFTTLMTGGLGLFIVTCALMPRDQLIASKVERPQISIAED